MKTKIIVLVIIVLVAISVLLYKQSVFHGESIYVAPSTLDQNASSATNLNQNGTTKSYNSGSTIIKGDIYTVSYTDKGFVPKSLQIPKGKSVKFVNNSSKSMRIFADDNSDPHFTDLNQPKSVGRGGVYTFNFTYTGVWAFHNQLNLNDRGNIVVY